MTDSEDLLKTIEAIAATRDPIQLKNIKAAVAELPFAVKNVLAPAKVMMLNPIDATAKKDFIASLDDVGDILLCLQAAVQNKDTPSQEKKLIDIKTEAIKRIIPKIEAGTERLTENQRDPRAKKQLIRLADRAGDKTQELNRVLAQVPSEQADQKKREMKLNIADMIKAIEEADSKKFQRSLKTLQKTLPEYKELLKTAALQTQDPKKRRKSQMR